MAKVKKTKSKYGISTKKRKSRAIRLKEVKGINFDVFGKPFVKKKKIKVSEPKQEKLVKDKFHIIDSKLSNIFLGYTKIEKPLEIFQNVSNKSNNITSKTIDFVDLKKLKFFNDNKVYNSSYNKQKDKLEDNSYNKSEEKLYKYNNVSNKKSIENENIEASNNLFSEDEIKSKLNFLSNSKYNDLKLADSKEKENKSVYSKEDIEKSINKEIKIKDNIFKQSKDKQENKTKKESELISTIDSLLDELGKRTSNLESNGTFLEEISFLDNKPKISKISYKNYKLDNLYSKISTKNKDTNKKDKNTNKKDINDNFDDSFLERIELPNISAIKDDTEYVKENIENNLCCKEKIDKKNNFDIPTFKKLKDGNIDFHPKVKDNIDYLNKIKKNKDLKEKDRSLQEFKDKLTEIDDATKKVLSKKSITKDNLEIYNQINNKAKGRSIDYKQNNKKYIPKVSFVDDNYKKENNNFSSNKNVSVEPIIETYTPKNDSINIIRTPTFKNKQEITKKLKPYSTNIPKQISQESIKDYDNKEINSYQKQKIKKLTGPLSQAIKKEKSTYTEKDHLEYPLKNESKNKKYNLYNSPENDNKTTTYDYILPVDKGKSKYVFSKNNLNSNLSNNDFDKEQDLYPTLVYSVPVKENILDIIHIYEKYNIDDFTYVIISYDKNEKNLFYNIIQPELVESQKKEYLDVKRVFFNTIDKNYYYFKGDKTNVENYIEKIYNITLDKLSNSIGSLEKKLYLKFIKREFSGLGKLTNLLNDKKIVEVSCAGENSNINVYHIQYGLLKTNMKFTSISEINQFVLTLTKNMGVYVNENQPIINGYLPNGYKVEGMYSLGDMSSRGSSFIIKKYLDEPITPVSLINISVGIVDVFAYIWEAINNGYKIIINGNDDSFMIFNALVLFYPNKKIISVQSYDRLKLPHDEWIKRIVVNNKNITKDTIINQSISERPDYMIVDEFGKEIFDCAWYNIDMFSVERAIVSNLIDEIIHINEKALIIDLNKVKTSYKEIIQIVKIREINDRKIFTAIEFEPKSNEYNINLLSSSLDVAEFIKKKKVLRWTKDSKIFDYKDFNSIISEYFYNNVKVMEKLGIKKE